MSEAAKFAAEAKSFILKKSIIENPKYQPIKNQKK